MKQIILRILLAVSVILLIFSAVKSVGYLTTKKLECEEWKLKKNTSINLSKWKKVLENEENTIGILLYSQEDDCLVKNTDLNREELTRTIKLYGNSAILFPDYYPLNVNDKAECLISQTLAEKLFGDTNVYGVVVTFNQKDYLVRGVIREEGNFFMYECDKSEDTFQYAYAKQFDDTVLGDEPINAFFLSQNVNGSKVVLSPRQENLQMLIAKENTYYELFYLRNLKQALNWGHIFGMIFLIAVFSLIAIKVEKGIYHAESNQQLYRNSLCTKGRRTCLGKDRNLS